MSTLSDRLKTAQEHVNDAHNELYALDESELKDHEDGLTRLDEAIAYSSLVLANTPPELLTEATAEAIATAALDISNYASTALDDPDTHAEALLDAIARLPISRGREFEQEAKEAASTFQRSASQRLAALNGELLGMKSALAAVNLSIEESKGNVSSEIGEQSAEFDAKLVELEQTITDQRQALDLLMTQQTKSFTDAQGERSTEHQELLEAFRDQLARTQRSAHEEIDERVAEIRRMEQESAELVGAIGLAGTAERYSEEARDQCKVANTLRRTAIGVAVLAVVVALVASFHHDQTTQSVSSKLGVSLILAGLSAYLARQSGRHRRREEYARRLQLELTAFSPFIEPLSKPQQEEERVLMTRKTFGRANPTPEDERDDAGPAPLSFLMQQRLKQLDDELPD